VTALAHGLDTVEVKLEQRSMRIHLYHCLKSGKITPFPHTDLVMLGNGVKTTEDLQIYCQCQMPEMNGIMVECSGVQWVFELVSWSM
jgi:hypothetical protein